MLQRLLKVATPLLLGGVLVTKATGQASLRETVLVRPTCATCKLEVKSIGGFGGGSERPADDGSPFEVVAMLRNGNLLGIARRPNTVWEFTTTGEAIRQYGRRGEGPGEIRSPAGLYLLGDSSVVYDRALGRLTIFSGTGQFIRALRLPPGMGGNTLLPEGLVVASGRLASSDPATRDRLSVFPLHLFRGDSLVRSFGDVIKEVDPHNHRQFDRIVLPYRGGILAISRTNRYVVDHWNSQATNRLSRLVREPEWFPAHQRVVHGDPNKPPTAYVVGAWLDESQRLWVVTNRARKTWRTAFGTKSIGEGGLETQPIKHQDLYFEAMVEVFDLQARKLLYSGSLPFMAHYVGGRGLVGTGHVDENGPTVKFFMLTLNVSSE